MKRLIFVLVISLVPSFAAAQIVDDNVTEIVPDTKMERLEDEERQGFDGTLSIAANVNLADNRDVVGQQDGLSTLFGLQLISGLDYLYRRHEVRNTLSITESWARTPTIPEFVKNTDAVELESLYNYFLLSWFGVFGRLGLNTALFESELVTAEEETYEIARNDGTVEGITTANLSLSDPFQPLSLFQSLGVFAEAIKSQPINLTVRAGLGARETFADGVLATADDDATEGIVEIEELNNVFQAGAEGFVGVTGVFAENRLTYNLGASILIPVLTNDETDRSATELTRLALVGKVAMSLTDWASLNYQLRILDDPQLLDQLQVQNALLLTFQYTFIERDGGKAGPTADEKLAEAEAMLKEAREKCEELEEKAAEAKAEAQAAKEREEADAAAREAAKAREAEAAESEKETNDAEPSPDAEPQPGSDASQDPEASESPQDPESEDPATSDSGDSTGEE